MSHIDLEELSWLPITPPNYPDSLTGAASAQQLRELANFRLNENQLRRLAKKLQDFRSGDVDLKALRPLKMGLIGNATTKQIIPSIIGTAIRYGISLEVAETEFNQVAQIAFQAEPPFSGQSLDFIFIAIDYHGIPLRPVPGDEQAGVQNVEQCFVYIQSLIQALRLKTGSQIIFQNIVPPPESYFGSFESRLPGSLLWLIQELNKKLDSLIGEGIFLLDVLSLAQGVGVLNWHDPTLWNMAKVPFSMRFIPIYADYLCRILGVRIGKSKRCLILDLDNTLWGGVIGDDGIAGIRLGNGDPTGEAHSDLQRIAMELRGRGIVLAISSKNEDAVARQVFREHPEMLIRENHIAVFQANWMDKASNIRAIANTLSLGLESMVFMDDNPAERAQVRRELPEVAVPELPQDPALYGRMLLLAGYFEATTFSEEDKARAGFYQENARRAEMLSQSSDMNAYLSSLEMEMTITPFDEIGRARIAQLISKSNQFNLTTQRYSENDVKAIQENPTYFARQIRLKDSLGDNGMISVLISKKQADFWEIDTWLMSCRVLGRRVEEAVLQEIVAHAKAAGAKKLRGIYIPSARNMIVKEHYQKLGFTHVSSDDKGDIWELMLDEYQEKYLPMIFKYDL